MITIKRQKRTEMETTRSLTTELPNAVEAYEFFQRLIASPSGRMAVITIKSNGLEITQDELRILYLEQRGKDEDDCRIKKGGDK